MDNSFQSFTKNKAREHMEDNRNSDKSEEELRRLIREEIHRSSANGRENLYERTQVMILQATSALVSSVNVDSGISSSLALSKSPSTNLTVLLGLSESTDNVSPCTHRDSSQQLKSQL